VPEAGTDPPAPTDPIDSDGDGISDADETDIYGTDPNAADSDGDGISDADEIAFWGNLWDADMDADGLINILDADADADGIADGQELSSAADPGTPDTEPGTSLVMEAGELSIDHQWTRVVFKRSFSQPVVIAKSLSRNDADPAVVRIRNINATGFDICIQEWDYLDGTHAVESVGYLVMESGTFDLPDGTRIEAGTFEATSMTGRVEFSSAFNSVPVVLTSIGTCSETDTVTLRPKAILSDGFDYLIQEQELNVQEHAPETIAYVACESFAGIVDNLAIEIGKTSNIVDDLPMPLIFSNLHQSVPVFISDMQTTDSVDPANVRWENKNLNSVDIRIAEETSKTSETHHQTEVVGYMIVSPAGGS